MKLYVSKSPARNCLKVENIGIGECDGNPIVVSVIVYRFGEMIMITLTEAQRDALMGICSVGMTKSARQLSVLLNSDIVITIPEINMFDARTLCQDKLFPVNNILSYVYHEMSGDMLGRAVLVFQRSHATLLTRAVVYDVPQLSEEEIRACEQEAMLEIGNIIISSCMGAIVNMLPCRITLGLPKYGEDDIDHLIKMQLNDVNNLSSEIMLIETKLETFGQDISGKLLLILTLNSIMHLFEKLNLILI